MIFGNLLSPMSSDSELMVYSPAGEKSLVKRTKIY